MRHHPDLKTYEDFLQHYEKESEFTKRELYQNFVFAQKEVERKKRQYQRRKARRQEEIAKLPEDERPKVGRPRKKTVEDYQKEVEDLKRKMEELRKQLEASKTVDRTPDLPPIPPTPPTPIPPTPVPLPRYQSIVPISQPIQPVFGNLITNSKIPRKPKQV